MRIQGMGSLPPNEIDAILAAGGRFVVFEYCISLLFVTLRQHSPVMLLRPGQLGVARGLRYSLISTLLGWWGLPWGLVYTPLVIVTNFRGGADVTPEVQAWLRKQVAETSSR